MPSLAELARNIDGPDFIRIREKQGNGFFGKILREGSKTLKQHGIKDRCSLVVQVLDEVEVLGPDDYILLFSKRDSATKTYKETRQLKVVNAQKLIDLQNKALEVFGGEIKKITKHVPHQFEWKVLRPKDEVKVKQKKKTVTYRLEQINLKQAPILLKDGDHIGVLIDDDDDDDDM